MITPDKILKSFTKLINFPNCTGTLKALRADNFRNGSGYLHN